MIRAARPEDAAAIGAMHAASWAEAYPPLVEAGRIPRGLFEQMTDRARRGAAWTQMLATPALLDGTRLAEEGGDVVGFVLVGAARDAALGTGGEVMGLYLLRRVQRRGLATALLGEGLGVLRAAGHRAAGAWAVDGNAPAERFYAARGAVPGPRRVEHRGPHALHETGWVWRDLSGWP